MAYTNLLLIALIRTILSARTGTGVSSTFALPARPVVLEWQTSFDVAPAAVSITIDVSMDGSSWTTLDTTTNVNGETRLINTPTAAVFVRANVATNTGNRAVTLTLIPKRTS